MGFIKQNTPKHGPPWGPLGPTGDFVAMNSPTNGPPGPLSLGLIARNIRRKGGWTYDQRHPVLMHERPRAVHGTPTRGFPSGVGDFEDMLVNVFGGGSSGGEPVSLPDYLGQMIGIPQVVAANNAKVAGAPVNTTNNGEGTITTADFVNKSGNCKANNFVAMNFVKSLQLALNRVAAATGLKQVTPDGEVGKGTLTLMAQVMAKSNGFISVDTSQCQFIAGDADVLTDMVNNFADQIKAPPVSIANRAQASTAGTIVTVSPTTGKETFVKPPGAQAGIYDVFKAMSTPQKVVFTGLLGGIGFLVYRKVKKGQGKGKR